MTDPHHQADRHQLPQLNTRSPSLDPVETKSHVADPSHIQGDEPDGDACIAFRHSGWRADRRRVLAALRRVSDSEARIQRFEACGRYAWVCVDRDDPDHWCVSASLCHDRLCVPCAVARARTVSSALASRARGRRILFVTLTLKHQPGGLGPQLDRLYKSFAALRRLALWRTTIQGGAAVLEVSRNPTRGTWHPHLHIIAEGAYLPVSDLRSAWFRITGDSHIVDIRLARTTDDLVGYLTKYVGKPVTAKVLRDPDALDDFVTAIHGRRLALTFGTWRGTPLTVDQDTTRWLAKWPLPELLEDAAAGLPYAVRILAILKGATQCRSP